MAEKLQGIFTPTLVPVDAGEQINEAELRRFVSWLIASGVHGLYPNGSTGEITRYTPIDITLYNIPMFASPIDVPTIRRLAADFPRIIGIKDSSGDISFMMRMIAAIRPTRPDFTFLTGWEAVLAPMLMVGCDGGTNASSNAVPEITRRIYELCQAGNYAEAMKWQFRVLELFDAMLNTFEFPDGFRAAAELRGFRFGHGRQPLSNTQEQDKTALSSVLH